MKMAVDIAKDLFRILSSEGVTFEAGNMQTLLTRYVRTAEDTITRYHADAMINGLMFDRAGKLIACCGANHGGQSLAEITPDGQVRPLVEKYQGHRFNAPNDLVIHPDGSIYFSDPRYLGHEPIDQPVVGVYRIDPDGKIARIITDAGKANGVCVSPDQKSLYVVSNDNGATSIERLAGGGAANPSGVDVPLRKGHMLLMAYDLSPDGKAKFRKTLVEVLQTDPAIWPEQRLANEIAHRRARRYLKQEKEWF